MGTLCPHSGGKLTNADLWMRLPPVSSTQLWHTAMASYPAGFVWSRSKPTQPPYASIEPAQSEATHDEGPMACLTCHACHLSDLHAHTRMHLAMFKLGRAAQEVD